MAIGMSGRFQSNTQMIIFDVDFLTQSHLRLWSSASECSLFIIFILPRDMSYTYRKLITIEWLIIYVFSYVFCYWIAFILIIHSNIPIGPLSKDLVIELSVALIQNQVGSLKSKGIDAIALGSTSGNKEERSDNSHRINGPSIPVLAFCTPKYLFDQKGV